MLREIQLNAGRNNAGYFLNILSQNTSGSWVLALPAKLRKHQDELELLLGRVFAGRPRCPENLELAQQLTLNWCISKCRKQGITLEDCLHDEGSV